MGSVGGSSRAFDRNGRGFGGLPEQVLGIAAEALVVGAACHDLRTEHERAP